MVRRDVRETAREKGTMDDVRLTSLSHGAG